MERVWTEEQERVISHRGGNLLVAAAAGSGKTAVLVEHVISLLTEGEKPASLSELLIMTFTESAAAEMKERIRLSLEERLRKDPENGRLIREAGNLQNANISTIDSFCRRLILENYASIDLDPSFRVGEEGELRLLRSDLVTELLEEHYESCDPGYLRFLENFTRGKDDAGIEELILKVYEYSEATPWPEDYLRDAEGKDLSLSEDYLLQSLKSRMEDLLSELEEALSIAVEEDGPGEYLPMLEEDVRALKKLSGISELPLFLSELSKISFSRLKATKSPKKEAAAGLRNGVKKELQKLQGRLFLPEGAEREAMQEGLSESIHVLLSLTAEFRERFASEKKRRKILDFSDLEHRALEILYIEDEEGRRPSPVADEYARQFREILIDEYQDSNFVQEELVKALSAERFRRPDVFQVGDVKQSIYSFRLARPDLFLGKYRDSQYPKVELSKNFRSREEVLRSVNQLFFRLMRAEVGGVDYTEEASLRAGRTDFPPAGERDLRTELLLVESGTAGEEEEEDGEGGVLGKSEAEARLIAGRIRSLREEGYRYRDIVILLRSPGSWADELTELLGNAGIPAYSISGTGFFRAVEVEIILAFLAVIDNPRQSIPLASLMHSPIYGFSDEELARIAAAGGIERSFPGEEELYESARESLPGEKGGTGEEDSAEGERERAAEERRDGTDSGSAEGEKKSEERRGEEGIEGTGEEGKRILPEELSRKLRLFRESLDHYRELSRVLSIHELLYRIYEESGYYHYVSAMPGGRKRRANLDQLIDSALSFEASSYGGLFDYIRYIERLRKEDADQGEAAIYSEQDDLVRILSVHRSKGLQFPVVILSGLNKRFNKRNLSGKVLIDPDLGIGADYIDPEKRIRYPSLQRMAIREKQENEQLGEELRVLYVAMTRAEQRLIMTASVTDMEKSVKKAEEAAGRGRLSVGRIRSASSMLDWILMAGGDSLLRSGSSGAIRLNSFARGELIESGKELLRRSVRLSSELTEALSSLDPEDAELQRLVRRFDFRYPHEDATKLFPKYSVSEIGESGEQPAEAVLPAPLERSDFPSDTLREAGVLSSENGGEEKENEKTPGARRGDAYHRALSRYDYLAGGGSGQLRALLTEEYALIDPESFQRFLDSELGREFREAAEKGMLFREQRFMKQVPFSYLFPESGITEPVLLQGVIDAFFLSEKGITLVDYKTDRTKSEEQLRRRYERQLSLYADALCGITGYSVRRKLIYSFSLGRAIELP